MCGFSKLFCSFSKYFCVCDVTCLAVFVLIF